MESGKQARSFWSTVTWSWRQYAVVLAVSVAAGSVGFFFRDPVYGSLAYGAATTVGMVVVGTAVWAFYRVLKAWVDSPSRTRLGRGLKAAARFLLIGPVHPGD